MALGSLIKSGEELIEEENYSGAIQQFDLALKESSSSYKALLGRSTANQRLKNYEALSLDLKKALKVARDLGKRENIAYAYLRLAIVFFNHAQYAHSLKAIERAKEYNCSDPAFTIWLAKITKKCGKENIEAEEFESTTAEITQNTPVLPRALGPKTPKMSFYQSDTILTVDFFYKNVTDPNIIFKETTLSVEFKVASGSDVIYEYNLFAPIIPEESSFKVMSTKVEVSLKKKQPVKWAALEGSGTDLDVKAKPQTSSGSSFLYPTSAKNKTNWSNFKVEDDPSDKEEEDQDENAFFKKLYAGADPDTQRAMMKSFVESNGTALSTNWSDTKDKKWETTPPDGVEARKWN